MKLAMMLGGLAAGRRAGGPGQLLTQGLKLLGQSPEVSRLTDELRGRLLEAGKGAAVAIATRQVEALTDRVVNRGAVTDAAGKTVSGARDAVGKVGKVGRTVTGSGRQAEPDAEPDVEPESGADAEYEDDYQDEYEDEDEPAEEDHAPERAEADEESDGDGDGDPAPKSGKATTATARRAASRTVAAGKGAAGSTLKGAAGAGRLAGKAAGRATRPVRGRQGRNDG
jgi:hypothetical protein